uniref:RNA-directed RNA polymerase n=1 Tax=Grapevine-associated RNA virus 9 TaxID=2814395 RepID=A0A8F5RC91_9VIRU|nr:MAG: RNA-dependent RNA polymerase [Grapevine-associated RNA virus 9]
MEFEAHVPELRGARVRTDTDKGKTRKGVWKIPCIGAGHWMSVYSTSVRVARAALMRRVLYRYEKDTDTYGERLVPSTDLVTERLGTFFSQLKSRLSANVVRAGLDEYPNFYSGGKKKVYLKAVESLVRWPYDRVRDAMVKGFVKVEPTQPGKDPRLIQTRGPRYHALLGSFVRPAEKQIYMAVDRIFGSRTIVKGLNAGQVGELIREKWEDFTDPVAVGLDASRFDRSVTVPLLRLVHSVLLYIYGNDSELASYLEEQLSNRGVVPCMDGIIKYDVEGGIMSGDVDTSLKGCVIMTALVWSWAAHAGVRIQLVDNGDDCVAFMERSDLQRFTQGMAEWFADFHMDIVAEDPVYELEKVVFCQTQPVLGSHGTYVMCRDPRTATVKDSMTIVNVDETRVFRRWATSVSACGLALAGDMPVFCEIYKAFGRIGNGENDNSCVSGGLKWLSHGMSFRSGVTERTRYSFWRAFDIPPFVQRELESYYQQVQLGIHKSDPKEISFPEKFHVRQTIADLFSYGA